MTKELQDLVWSVLPKEFKEEVKKIYSALLADIRMYQGDNPEQVGTTDSILWERTLGIKSTLCRLFGEHNLTSDAEGEEMLTVPRSKVQEQYALNTNALREGNLTDMQTEIAVKVKDTLYYLFGSKCLPDENKECSNPSVVNCKHKHGDGTCSLSGMCCYKSPKPAEPEEKDDCKKFTKRLDDTLEGDIKEPFKEWRDKNSSNVEKLEKNGEVEPKPAEPKFKIGDKIRIVKGGVFYDRIGEVTDIDFIGSLVYYKTDRSYEWLRESDLEPYTEPKEEASKMKPIESKVRVYLATKEEDEEFRQLLYKNGFKWNTGESLIDNSVWSFDKEESKIHNIYPNKIVTYSGDITPNILPFSNFKKQYFEENVNLSQETANCDKQFDSILKDGFSKERRLNIAAMIIQGIMANSYWTEKRMSYALRQNENKEDAVNEFINDIIEDAVNLTDALIAEAGKGDKK